MLNRLFRPRPPMQSERVTEENILRIANRALAFAGTSIVYSVDDDGSSGVLKYGVTINCQFERIAKFAARYGYRCENLGIEHMAFRCVRLTLT